MRGARALLLALAACGSNPAFDASPTAAAASTTAPASTTAADLPPPTSSGASTTPADPGTTSSSTTAREPATTTSSATATDETAAASTGAPDDERPCPDDPALLACYRFPAGELAVLVDDGPGQRDGVMSDINLVASLPGLGAAAEFVTQSRATVAYDPAFNPPAFTLAAFVYVKSKNRAVLDKHRQYAMFVETNEASCIVRKTDMAFIIVKAPIVEEEWLHLACTYDGATLRIHVQRAGMPVISNPTDWNQGVDTTPDSDLALGRDNPEDSAFYVGLLDHVLLYSRALTPPELCDLAAPLCPP